MVTGILLGARALAANALAVPVAEFVGDVGDAGVRAIVTAAVGFREAFVANALTAFAATVAWSRGGTCLNGRSWTGRKN